MASKNTSIKHIAFEVFGKVQGVFFRKHTAAEATKLHLVGYCENTKQDTVKGEAIGTADAIEKFAHWLRHVGSPKSTITELKHSIKDAPTSHSFTTFEIRR